MKTERLHSIDTIRGITMLSMILYHFCWDLKYINGFDMPWYGTSSTFLWQQSICWMFILISGFCLHFSRNGLKNGVIVFLCGVVVSCATMIVIPEAPVHFGVLTLLGSSMILVSLVKMFVNLKDTDGQWYVLLCAVLFVLTRHINAGIIGIGPFYMLLPKSLYSGGGADGMGMSFLTYLGFMQNGFYSSDYFSLMPWFFLFLTGYFLYFSARSYLDKPVFKIKMPFFTWFGRHSLIVYMLHQVVLYVISMVIWQIQN